MATLSSPAHRTLVPLPDQLESDRIVLRPYRGEDGEAVFAAIDEARGHLAPWMDWTHHHRTADDSRDYCLRMAAAWILRTDLTVGVFDRVDGRVLGGAGFHVRDWERRVFEVGYWLRPTAVGNGHATAAVRLLVNMAFRDLTASRVELVCDANNESSRRVAERAGFVFEGTLRNRFRAPGGLVADALMFSLVPGDPGAAPTARDACNP